MRSALSILAVVIATSTAACSAHTDPSGDPPPIASAAANGVQPEWSHVYLRPSLDVYQTGPGLFAVRNNGSGATGWFHIAVLAGSQSYSISAGPLMPGGSFAYELPTSLCGVYVSILVDPYGEVWEFPAGQHSLNTYGPCNW